MHFTVQLRIDQAVRGPTRRTRDRVLQPEGAEPPHGEPRMHERELSLGVHQWLRTQPSEELVTIGRVRLLAGTHPEESARTVIGALPWIGGDEYRLERRFTRLKATTLRQLAFSAESMVQRTRDRADYAFFTGRAGLYGDLVAGVQAIDADHARDFAERLLSRGREPARPPRS